MTGNRIESFDLLKCLAIFLVVWCHVIQFWGNHLFDYAFPTYVYAFHMPVFMVLAGFLFEHKLKTDLVKTSLKQFTRLIVPSFTGGVIVLIYTLFIRKIGMYDILHLPFYCWFLSSLFVCSVLYLLLSRVINNVFVETIALSFLVLLLPGAEYLKFMVPFFGVGLCLSRWNALSGIKSKPWTIVASLVSVLLLVFVWKSDYTIYITKSPTYNSLLNIELWKAFFIRLIVGTSITIALIGIASQFKMRGRFKEKVTRLSRDTLGVYLLQSIMFDCTKRYISLPDWGELGTVAISFIITIVLVGVICLAIFLIRRNNLCSRLLLGEAHLKNNYESTDISNRHRTV